MEVGVSITHQSMAGGCKVAENALRAYVTMVDVDEAGRAGKVPSVAPQSVHEKRRFEMALIRKENTMVSERRHLSDTSLLSLAKEELEGLVLGEGWIRQRFVMRSHFL